MSWPGKGRAIASFWSTIPRHRSSPSFSSSNPVGAVSSCSFKRPMLLGPFWFHPVRRSTLGNLALARLGPEPELPAVGADATGPALLGHSDPSRNAKPAPLHAKSADARVRMPARQSFLQGAPQFRRYAPSNVAFEFSAPPSVSPPGSGRRPGGELRFPMVWSSGGGRCRKLPFFVQQQTCNKPTFAVHRPLSGLAGLPSYPLLVACCYKESAGVRIGRQKHAPTGRSAEPNQVAE